MKAGLLLPRSGAWPAISVDLVAALRHALKHSGRGDAVSFISENINFGGSDKEVYEKAEKLLITEAVDILIAYIDMKVIPLLEPLMFATGKLLIILNPGANYPEKKVPQPGIIYLTMQHSFMCSLTGHAAGNNVGIYATTFYDCGYMHGAAMITGFEQNGGSVVFNYVNRDLYDDSFGIPELIDFLDADPEKTVSLLCIFDEKPASLFYRKLNEYERAGRIKLYVSPMMLTKNAIGDGDFRFSIDGYTTWLPRVNDAANDMLTGLKKDADIFSALGLQAGILLNEILGMRENILSSGEEIVKRLEKITIPALGGPLTLDPQTHFYMPGKLYRCSLTAGEKELMISPEKIKKSDWENYLTMRNDLPSSGWTNTYLCY